MNPVLEKVITYAKSHWKSEVDLPLQVRAEEYPAILTTVMADITKGKSLNKKIVRIAGISGSGKTTQLVPAAEAYFEARKESPVLVAARVFAPYHPHYEEIMAKYGEENIRRHTDEFATIMLFLVISELIHAGFDIILDVALLDPSLEQVLEQMLNASNYEELMLLIAVSPEVAGHQLASRNWRHSKSTEEEFARVMTKALEFYAQNFSNIHTIIWNTYDESPVYDGPVKNAMPSFIAESAKTDIPPHDEKVLLESKVAYLSEI